MHPFKTMYDFERIYSDEWFSYFSICRFFDFYWYHLVKLLHPTREALLQFPAFMLPSLLGAPSNIRKLSSQEK